MQSLAGVDGQFCNLSDIVCSQIHLFHALGGAGLNSLDRVAHVRGGGHGLFGQLAHFIRHHGETSPRFTRPGGLNGGIEGQQIGLIRNIGDDSHDPADGLGVFRQFSHIGPERQRRALHVPDAGNEFLHRLRALFGPFPGGGGHFGCRPRISGHFQHGGIHFLHGGGGFRHSGRLFGRTPFRLFDLGGEFRRGGRHHI